MTRYAKEKEQLNEAFSTARSKLVTNIIWMLIQEAGRTKCFVCNEEMTRETFTIEHKVPWLDSDSPKELFHDLNNISFSHKKCNKPRPKYGPKGTIRPITHGKYGFQHHKCRCTICVEAQRKYQEKKRSKYDPNKRHEKYLRNGT